MSGLALSARQVLVAKWILLYTVLLGIVLYVLGPFLAIMVTAFGEGWFGGRVLPAGWTMRWFDWALTVTRVGPVLVNSFSIALLSITISLVVGIPTAWAMARHGIRAQKLIMALILLPRMIPPIAFALGVARQFYGLRLIDTHLGVALAHAILIVPFVILIMSATFEGLDERVLEAGAICGARPSQTFRYVVVPLALPGLFASVLFGLVTSYNEFTLTLMTYGPSTLTLTVQTYLAIGEGFTEVASAISVILLAPSLVILLLLQRHIRPENLVGGFKGL